MLAPPAPRILPLATMVRPLQARQLHGSSPGDSSRKKIMIGFRRYVAAPHRGSRTAWPIVVVALALASALGAQSPLISKSSLPPPACGTGIQAIADFDSSGRPDFLVIAGTPGAPAIAIVHDPATAGGGACLATPIPLLTSQQSLTVRLARLNGDSFPDAILSSGYENRILDALGNGSGGFSFPGTGAYAMAPASGYVKPGRGRRRRPRWSR